MLGKWFGRNMLLYNLGVTEYEFGRICYTVATPFQEKYIPALMDRSTLFIYDDSDEGKMFAFSTAVTSQTIQAKGIQALIIIDEKQDTREYADSMTRHCLHTRHHATTAKEIEENGKKIFKEADVAICFLHEAHYLLTNGFILPKNISFILFDGFDRIVPENYDLAKEVYLLCRERRMIFLYSRITVGMVKLSMETGLGRKFNKNEIDTRSARETDTANQDEKSGELNVLHFHMAKKYSHSLASLLNSNRSRLRIIFCNRQSVAERLALKLKREGVSAIALPGRYSEKEAFPKSSFKDEISTITCTDMGFRQVGMAQVTSIYHYDMPRTREQYLKRLSLAGFDDPENRHSYESNIISENCKEELERQLAIQISARDTTPKQAVAIEKAAKKDTPQSYKYPLFWHLNVEISAMCNYNCKMCGFQRYYHPKGLMSLETYKKIEGAIKLVRSVMFGFNAETLMNPQVVEMLEFTMKANPKCEVTIITNGALLTEELSEKFVKLRLQVLSISLDAASKELHESIRRGSDFDKVMHNIERLAEIKKKYKSKLPRISTTFVGMKSNIGELPGVVKIAKELGFESIRFTNLEPYTPEMQKEVLYGENFTDHERNILKSCREECEKHGIRFSCPKFKSHSESRCIFLQPIITYTGEVIPCAQFSYERDTYYYGKKVHHPVISFGNINEKSFEQIWRDKRYRKFRQDTYKGKMHPFCRESCLLRERVICPK